MPSLLGETKAGKRRGAGDPRSAALMSVLSYTVSRRPRLVILEQVPGLLHKPHRAVFRGLLSALKRFYFVSWKAAASA